MMVFLRSTVVLLFLAAAAFAQNEVISPNENLVVEGVPPIPASLAETVGRYTNFRGASLQSWDPINRELLISTRFADTVQIHLVKMPGGARIQLTFYPDSVNRAEYSPVKNDYFLFDKDVGGGEVLSVYRADRGNGEIPVLADGTARTTA